MSESISDGQGADTVVATACGSESDVVTLVVLDKSLAQQSIVLDLGLAKRRSVASHNDQLSLATSEGLQGGQPRTYFPDFITRASFWLMDSPDFFFPLAAPAIVAFSLDLEVRENSWTVPFSQKSFINHIEVQITPLTVSAKRRAGTVYGYKIFKEYWIQFQSCSVYANTELV